MKVVIAGGTGLIGRRLVRSLLAADHDVVILSRAAAAEAGGARVVRWDARTPTGPWVDELVGADAVVNLAGAGIGDGRWTRKRKDEIVTSRVEATSALCGAIGALATERRPGALVSSSGIDYYGDSGEQIVDEDSAAGSSYLASVCVAWEKAAAQASEHGVRVVVVRTPLVLASEAKAVRLMRLPFRLFVGGKLGHGRQWFPWIHIEDMVAVLIHAIQNADVVGPVNAVASGIVRQSDAAHAIGRAMKRPAMMPTPAPVLRLALGEQADLLLHGQRAESIRLREFEFGYPELPGALEEVFASD